MSRIFKVRIFKKMSFSNFVIYSVFFLCFRNYISISNTRNDYNLICLTVKRYAEKKNRRNCRSQWVKVTFFTVLSIALNKQWFSECILLFRDNLPPKLFYLIIFNNQARCKNYFRELLQKIFIIK